MKTWTIIDEKIFDLVKPENVEDEALKNVLEFLIPFTMLWQGFLCIY